MVEKISFVKYRRLSFGKVKFVAKFQTVEIPAMNSAENGFFSKVEAISWIEKKHVNISTDKYCTLRIRQVLHLARMQSY